MASVSIVEHLRKFRIPKNTKSFLAAWAQGLGMEVDCDNLEQTFRRNYAINTSRITPVSRKTMNDAQEGIFVHRAGKGAGKTENAARLFKSAVRCVALSPTRALSLDISRRFEICNYLDRDAALGAQKLALCVPSLGSKGFEVLKQKLDILFIDEASLLPQNIIGLGVNPWAAIDTLYKLLNSAEKVILADAWMSDDALDFYKHLTDRQIYLVDEPIEPSTKKAVVYPEASLAYNKMRTLLAAGAKLAIACETIEQVNSVEAFLKKNAKKSLNMGFVVPDDANMGVFAGSKYLGLHGMTIGDVRASASYDVIIYTCSMGSGVSIVDEEYKHVFLFYRGLVLTPQAANQMLGRFRNAEYLHITPNNNPATYKEVDPEELPPRTLAEAQRIHAATTPNSEAPEEAAVKARYLAKLRGRWGTITSNARCQASLKLLLLLRAESVPTRMSFANSSDVLDGMAREPFDMTEARTERREEILDVLSNTRLLTPQEYEKANNKRRSIEKTQILETDARLLIERYRLHVYLFSRSHVLNKQELRTALGIAQECEQSLPLRLLGTANAGRVGELLPGSQKQAWTELKTSYPSIAPRFRVGERFGPEAQRDTLAWLTNSQTALENFAKIPKNPRASWVLKVLGFAAAPHWERRARVYTMIDRDQNTSEILTKLLSR